MWVGGRTLQTAERAIAETFKLPLTIQVPRQWRSNEEVTSLKHMKHNHDPNVASGKPGEK
jgi:hypothetical protein